VIERDGTLGVLLSEVNYGCQRGYRGCAYLEKPKMEFEAGESAKYIGYLKRCGLKNIQKSCRSYMVVKKGGEEDFET
jgi:hypothetical protein